MIISAVDHRTFDVRCEDNYHGNNHHHHHHSHSHHFDPAIMSPSTSLPIITSTKSESSSYSSLNHQYSNNENEQKQQLSSTPSSSSSASTLILSLSKPAMIDQPQSLKLKCSMDDADDDETVNTKLLLSSRKAPSSTSKSTSQSSTTTTTAITKMNTLDFIMNTFQCNINQEQAWALIYQSTKTLNELLMKYDRNEMKINDNINDNNSGNSNDGKLLLLRKLTSFTQIQFDHNGNVCSSTWKVSINNYDNIRATNHVLLSIKTSKNDDDIVDGVDVDEANENNDIVLFTKNDDKRLMNESINCLIASLATIIYSALEWNWKNCHLSSSSSTCDHNYQSKNNNNYDNSAVGDGDGDDDELDLDESLELLMLSMIRGSEHKDLVDEGYIDAMEESCLNWVLVKCEQHYQTLVQSTEKNATIEMLLTKNQLNVDYYYQTICKMMLDEAIKLNKLFNQFYEQTMRQSTSLFDQKNQKNFINSSKLLQSNQYNQLVDTEDLKIWAQTWIKVMSELRFGVRLRQTSFDESKVIEKEKRLENDELLRNIENIRENLRKAANRSDDKMNSEPSSLRLLPIMFTKESIIDQLNNLKPASQRVVKKQLPNVIEQPCLHEQLMNAIRNFDHHCLRRTITEIKPNIKELYLQEQRHRKQMQTRRNHKYFHHKSLSNINRSSIIDNRDNNDIIDFNKENHQKIKRKMYSPDHSKLIYKKTNNNSNNNLLRRSLNANTLNSLQTINDANKIRPTLSLSHLLLLNNYDNSIIVNNTNSNDNQQQRKQPDELFNKKKRLSLKDSNIHHDIYIRNSTPKFQNDFHNSNNRLNRPTSTNASPALANTTTPPTTFNDFRANNYLNHSPILCNSSENVSLVNDNSSTNDNTLIYYDHLNNNHHNNHSRQSFNHRNNCSLSEIRKTDQFLFIDDDDDNNEDGIDDSNIDNYCDDHHRNDDFLTKSSLTNLNPLLRRSFIRKPSRSIINNDNNYMTTTTTATAKSQSNRQSHLQKLRCSSFSALPKPSMMNNHSPTLASSTTTTADSLGFRSLFVRKTPFRSSLSLVWSKIFGGSSSASASSSKETTREEFEDDCNKSDNKLKQD